MKNGRFAQAFARLMAGRYGVDQLTRFISGASLVCIVLSTFLRSLWKGRISGLLFWICIALLGWSYYRMFSRNYSRRRAENERYLSLRNRVLSRFRLHKECFRQRKDYVFYRCPGCRQLVRVPRGKGKIRITCRRCGFSFEKKT